MALADNDDCDDDTRSLSNDKGSAVLDTFKALGFDPELLEKITKGLSREEGGGANGNLGGASGDVTGVLVGLGAYGDSDSD